MGWSGVCRPPTAIAGWVRDVPPAVLADLYLRAGACPARPPSKAMIWRVVTDADAGAFDAAVGTWLMSSLSGEPAGQGEAAGADRDDPAELMPVRLDGKTVRGARDAVGNQRHHHGELSQYTQQFYEPYARYPAPVFAVPGNHDGDPLPGASSLDGCLRVMATPSRSPLHPSPCPAPRTPQPLRLFTLALLNQQVGPALQRCPFVRCAAGSLVDSGGSMYQPGPGRAPSGQGTGGIHESEIYLQTGDLTAAM